MSSLWEQSFTTFFHPTTGAIASGALAYFYNENTSTPRTTYSDAVLATPRTNPVVANAAGMFGSTFLQTGDYRLRITTSDGTEIIDQDNISPPITTEAEASGGVSAEFLIATGQLIHKYGTGAVTGFVRANGRTIGNAASGATERANADTSALYTFLYNGDTNLTVSGGRGANAAADYAANKTIALPDMRGRALVGLDDMGNSAAGVITGVTTLGVIGGEQTHALVTGELAAHTHAAGTLAADSNGAHTHFTVNNDTSTATAVDASKSITKSSNVVSDFSYILNGTATAATLGLTSSSGAHTHTVSGSSASSGSGTGHNNLQPYMPVTIYIKL
jgi:microcystin-dependent protein